MKKFIRYLYEYQHGQRIQNVGFVKVEHSDEKEVVQVYGKGFPAAGNQEMEVFVFYKMGQRPVGISMGSIKSTKPVFGYRLEYTPEDVGGQEVYENIEGIILLNDVNGYKKWYSALWEESSIVVEDMLRREEVLRQKQDEDPVIEEPIIEAPEPEEPMIEAPVIEAPEPEEPVALEPMEKLEETFEMVSEEVHTEEMGEEESDWEEQRTPIYKITRKDLANLSRREWRLANNNFLVHGYHNYHHLVSFEKDGGCWLGVPGVYHPREQRAAEAFGFGQFMKPDEGEVELSTNEMNGEEDFGYWCRQVTSAISGEK